MPPSQPPERTLCFNGINGATGDYLSPPARMSEIAEAAKQEVFGKSHEQELRARVNAGRATYGITSRADPNKLDEAGWGVIFHVNMKPEVKDHLKELLEWRKSQAGRLYREWTFEIGDDKNRFLERHKIGPGPVDPAKGPYYLMIVGDPEAIPFRFQYELDVQFAVGRLAFDRLEDYAQYARSVVDAERGKTVLARKAVFFGPQNQDDRATQLSSVELVKPLTEELGTTATNRKIPWDLRAVVGAQATKANLAQLLGGPDTPAFLFTASHGMGFPTADPRQAGHQGALLCQDWPGPLAWRKAILADHYFAGEDVRDQARLHGLIAFHFACYGAGTPQLDDFSHQSFRPPTTIAPRPFVARLPQRLLGHPNGGALAVVGHVERAWGWSFAWGTAGRQIEVFLSTIWRLMDGWPIGAALEDFNERYAELSTVLSNHIDNNRAGKKVDDAELAELWTANNDARSYILLGDPAVRLCVAAPGAAARGRATIETITAAPPPPAPSTDGRSPANPSAFLTNEPGNAMTTTRDTTIQNGTVTITIPLEITVRLGDARQDATLAGVAAGTAGSNQGVLAAPGKAFAITIDPDYESREGYDPKFLGTGGQKVPLPRLSAEQATEAASVRGAPLANPHELRYHHFSLVMNARRRLPFFTAVNIDGERATFNKELKRANDVWFFDPRIDRAAQTGNDLYANNPFDRGHLVRRLDPAWGRTLPIAKNANDDTFHFTNCSPQHERFNQGKNLWAGLEDYLLEKAAAEGQRLTVFTGPVFRTSDPVYRSVPIPVEYWKVAVVGRPGGRLASLAFLVTQENLVRSVSFGPAQVAQMFQTSVRHIESLTGLDFGTLRDADFGSVDSFAVEPPKPRELQGFEDIRLPAGMEPVNPAREGAGSPAFAAEVVGGTNRVPDSNISYFLLAFDENAAERQDGPAGAVSDRILEALGDSTITDVILFSHGWKGDVPGAREQYNAWIGTMAANTADLQTMRARRPGFRPLLIGLHWPSLPFGDERLDSLSFGGLQGTPPWAAEYVRRLGGSSAVRGLVELAVELATSMSGTAAHLPGELEECYRDLARAVGLANQGVSGSPGHDNDGFNPDAIYQDALSMRGAAAFGLLDRDLLLAPLRQLSFWKMKDLARLIGENGVYPFLSKLQQATASRDVRYHLTGHSFGCIVASAALAGPPGADGLLQAFDSLVLLQGALSLWSYSPDIPYTPGKPGYFNRVVAEKRVRGPIVTTRTKFDRALGSFYPLGARAAGQVAFDTPSLPKYGATGAYGIQGGDLPILDQTLSPVEEAYRFQPGSIYNLEASAVIQNGGGFSGAHSDLDHPEVAHAVWSAIAGS